MAKILMILTIPLIAIHMLILYFWIFDWRQLVTQVGMISWMGTIILGILFSLFFRSITVKGRLFQLLRSVLFWTTVITILLGLFALIIEAITSSMP
ncbi:hypothetical protein BN1058_00275 [Paraliobacillus sp. PM-2]|uniref:hypothetical protein n=1 Tax=Paraliobacillus sp. PM-2 TaxID=1462524 RepID=UPI00061C310D|nr:hypothetical protein [Paraliobacillus sp. PM-2]CQR46031.1 hypothetical protein BN1058_00275 [Paraliobacillus sp. PM-2]